MTRFTLAIRNLRALRDVEWALQPVNLLVGANGSGKSTALLALKLVRAALDRGWPEAISMTLGGSHTIRNRRSEAGEPVRIEIGVDDLRWSIDYFAEQGVVHETLQDGERGIFGRRPDGRSYVDHPDAPVKVPGLKVFSDSPLDIPEVEKMVRFVRSVAVFHDPDIVGIRAGSDTTHNRRLLSRGQNALTMMRQWHQRRPDRWRYAFVLKGLQAAFPGLIEDLDFVEAGTTLAARVYRPGQENPEPLGTEANGVLAMLLHLCALAAVDDGGVVAIDEPENALHPYAIRVFARCAERLARQRATTVILSTHSPVLLDHFGDRPQQVYVLDPDRPKGPTALTDLKNPDWLNQFRLGALYADGEIASNADMG